MIIELHGAYGRETNMQDWFNGKDFKIHGGPYCSIRDVEQMRTDGYRVLVFVDADDVIMEVIKLV
jgi:hypothetical protein